MSTIKQDEITIKYPKDIWNIYHAEVNVEALPLSSGLHYIVYLHCELGEKEDWSTDIRIDREFGDEEGAIKLYKKWRKTYVKAVRKLTNLHDCNDTEFWDIYLKEMKEVADSLL